MTDHAMNSQVQQIEKLSTSHKDHELSPLERLPAEIRNRIFSLAVRKDAYVELHLTIFYGINTFVLNATDKDYGAVFHDRVKAFVLRWGKYLKFMKRFGAYSPDTFYCFNMELQAVPYNYDATLLDYKRMPPRHHVDREGNSVPISRKCDLTRVHISINEDASVQVDFSSLDQPIVPPCVCRIKHASSSDNGKPIPGMLVARLMLAAMDDLGRAMRPSEDAIGDDELHYAVLEEIFDEMYGDEPTMEAHDRAWATTGCNDCRKFRVCVSYDGHSGQSRPEAK